MSPPPPAGVLDAGQRRVRKIGHTHGGAGLRWAWRQLGVSRERPGRFRTREAAHADSSVWRRGADGGHLADVAHDHCACSFPPARSAEGRPGVGECSEAKAVAPVILATAELPNDPPCPCRLPAARTSGAPSGGAQRSLWAPWLATLLLFGGFGSLSQKGCGLRSVDAAMFSPTCSVNVTSDGADYSRYYMVQRSFMETEAPPEAQDPHFAVLPTWQAPGFSVNGSITEGDLNHEQESGPIWSHLPTVVACEVQFPDFARDAMLWHFGAKQAQNGQNEPARGAWLGLRGNSSQLPRLRLRVGNGDNISECGGSEAKSSEVACVDIDYSSLMGEVHQLVAWLSDTRGSDGGLLEAKLWIDGIYQGGASVDQGQSPLHWPSHSGIASFGLQATDWNSDWGEDNTDWDVDNQGLLVDSSNNPSRMKLYVAVTPQPCIHNAGGSRLHGDWSNTTSLDPQSERSRLYFNSLTYHCCETCPDHAVADVSVTNGSAATACLCKAGYHQSQGGCLECSEGKIKTSVGSGACKACEAGSYIALQDTLNGLNCSECETGKFNNASEQTACVNCAQGSYKNVTGSGLCTVCRETTTTASDGATSCANCVRNAYPRHNSIEEYQTHMSESPCVQCPVNSMPSLCVATGQCTVSDPKHTNCTCNIGFYGTIETTSSTCAPCPNGTTTEVQGASTAAECECMKGYEGNTSGVSCAACTGGKKKNFWGLGNCSMCGTTDRHLATSLDGTTCTCKAGAFPASGLCVRCPAGKFKDSAGDEECQSCPKGKFQTLKGQINCTVCPAGTYNNRIGSFGSQCHSCKECPANTDSMQGSPKRTSCISNAGYTARDGSVGVACPAGSYKSVPGFSACMKCVDTISTSAPGSSRCSCNVGYSGGNASQVDGAGCIPCGVGFAQDVTDSATCKVCPEGTYTSRYNTGSSACVACTANSFSKHTVGFVATANTSISYPNERGSSDHCSDLNCTACNASGLPMEDGRSCGCQCMAVGRSSRSWSDCLCNAGFDGPSNNCTACARGKFKVDWGARSCAACPAGKYQDKLGATFCLDCPQNSDSLQGSGSSSMCLCEPGYGSSTQLLNFSELRLVTTYSTNTSSNQTFNTSEWYNFTWTANVSVCTSCVAGKYREGGGNQANGNGDCLTCRNNSDSSEGASYCQCNIGYVSKSEGDSSSPCDVCTLKSDSGIHKLHESDITTTDAIGDGNDGNCVAGRWWRVCTVSGDAGCVRCPSNSHSLYASEGVTSCSCNKGYYGPDGGPCRACPANTYKNITGDHGCTICPGMPGLLVSPNASVSVTNCTCPLGYEAKLGPNMTKEDMKNPAKYTADCQCTPGYYWDPITETCRDCLPNSWNNVSASTDCTPCERGKYANINAATVCTLCTPVTMCPSGQYWKTCPGPVDGHCTLCTRKDGMPLNAGFAGPGWPLDSDSCPYTCNSGYQAFPADARFNPAKCEECREGKYRGKFDESCTDCPHPSTTKQNASVYCTDCAQGYCFNGFDSDGHSVCIKCPSSHSTTQPDAYERDYTDECRCEPGYDGFSWACGLCRPGTYKTDITSSSDFSLYLSTVSEYAEDNIISFGDTCQSCPDGKFNNMQGSTTILSCTQCRDNAGTWGDTSRCICDAGFYDMDSSDQARCHACPPDTYQQMRGTQTYADVVTKSVVGSKCVSSNEQVCHCCPDNSASPAASTDITNCTCNAGFYLNVTADGGRRCEMCPANTYATANDVQCIQCPTGTYTISDLRDSIEVCVCPPDTYGVLNLSRWDFKPATLEWHLKVVGSSTYLSCNDTAGWSAWSDDDHDITCCTDDENEDCVAYYEDGCDNAFVDSNGLAAEDACCYCGGGTRWNATNFTFMQHHCLACPPNAVTNAGSTTIDSCECMVGKAGDPTEGDGCQSCPGDSYPREDRRYCMCNAGFYDDFSGGVEAFFIDATSENPAQCTECPPDSTSSFASIGVASCSCNSGHYGRPDNSTASGRNSPCMACPDFSWSDAAQGAPLNITHCTCNMGHSGDPGEGIACEKCTDRDPNSYTNAGDAGAQKCTCNMGYYGNLYGDDPICHACPLNTYNNRTSQTSLSSCKQCHEWSTTSTNASVRLSDCECQPGYYHYGAEGAQCLPCAADTYQDERGKYECKACPSNSIAPSASGKRADCLCKRGYYWVDGIASGGECVPCSNTSFKAFIGDEECEECPQYSSASADRTSCECNAGYFGGPLPQFNGGCTACKANTYQPFSDRTNVTYCLECPANAFSGVGSKDCTCDANHYGQPDAQCTACPSNAVSNAGSTHVGQCKCNRGYYYNATSSQPCWPAHCPVASDTRAGATDPFDCICNQGFYGDPPNSVNCTMCPANSTSSPGTLLLSGCRCMTAFYGSPGNHVACTSCGAGALAPEGSEDASACQCAEGFFGTPVGSPLFSTSTLIASSTAVHNSVTPAPTPTPALPLSIDQYCKSTEFGGTQDVLGPTVFPASFAFDQNATSGFDPEYPPSTLATSMLWNSRPAILACSVLFPAVVQDALLWRFGDTNRSASLGMRSNDAPPALRLRAGDSRTITNVSVDVVFVDVTDFPADDAFHEVVAFVDCTGDETGGLLRVALYLDGALKAVNESTVLTCSAGWAARGMNLKNASINASYGLAVQGDLAALGEPNVDWPLGPGGESGIGSDLRLWHTNVTWPTCLTFTNTTHWLVGSWSSAVDKSTVSTVCCNLCPENKVSNGTDRSTIDSCQCNAGFTGAAGSAACTACVEGKYKSIIGSSSCISCDYGSFSPTPGRSSCTGSRCKLCPSHATSDKGSLNLGSCQCKAGFYGNASAGVSCVTDDAVSCCILLTKMNLG